MIFVFAAPYFIPEKDGDGFDTVINNWMKD